MLCVNKERRKTAKNTSIEIFEKDEIENLSECFPTTVLIKSSEEISDQHTTNTPENARELHFQSEPHALFEQEPTYAVDAFQRTDRTVEKLLTLPPDFKTALAQIPQSLQAAFKDILNAEIIGVWPIGNDCLRR